MITEKGRLKFGYMRFFIFLPFIGLTFSCPTPKDLQKVLEKNSIPIEKVKTVEPFKEIPQLCYCTGFVKKGNSTIEVDFYVSKDGSYFIPFVGKVVYKPSGIKGIKRITVISLRNSNHTLNLGFVTSDLKYYFPQLIPIKVKSK